MKVNELKLYVEQRGFLQPGEATGATIMVNTNRARYKHFKEFFGNPRVHQIVGSKQPDDILEAMIQACEGDWLEIAERQERAREQEVGR